MGMNDHLNWENLLFDRERDWSESRRREEEMKKMCTPEEMGQ